MKKSFLTLMAVVLSCTFAAAQSDEAVFAAASWETSNVGEGLVLKQCSFPGTLFNSYQYISVLEVSGHRIDIVDAPDSTLERTTALAGKHGAVAAINGGFFRTRAPYGSFMYLQIDHQKKAGNGNDSGNGKGSRSTRQNGAVVTYGGETFIVKADCLQEWESKIQAEDIITSGPVMRIDGADTFVQEVPFNTIRHPRTAVGKKADGTIVFVVVDGRSKGNAQGMSIFELRSIMGWLGCKDAINLDGGGSSAMVIGDKLVNYPCDNKKFDHEGERKVANALIVR